MVSRTADGVTINFGYDEEDRLQRIVRSVAGQMVFTHLYNYDGLGRRFFRWISDSGTSRSVVYRFAGDALLREQWNNPNPNNHLMMDWKYTWAGGIVNAVNIQCGDQWWSGGDRLGSARVHTEETGSPILYIGYFTAFGERLDVGFRTAYTFAGDWGYRDDGDAGLLHVGARYYDPQVGRFLSRDAVLSEHPYLYCEHEPVNVVDPSGYFKVETFVVNLIVLGGGGALVGGLPGGAAGALAAVGVAWEEGDAGRLWNWIKRTARGMAAYYADHPPVWVR
jgi:RHS repeat-associated protein